MDSKIIEAIKSPWKIFLHISRPLEQIGFFDKWSDEKWIKVRYWLRNGKYPDLENPKTYNEKLQWIKLHDRNPLYTILVDKYEVKKYVQEKISRDYVIPVLGIWDSFDEIDFSKLPNQFVLKCTHDSGGIVICKDKSKFDKSTAKGKIEKSLRTNYYLRSGREWPYKNVNPRIMAETYMEDSKTKELRDYKFFAFDGDVKVLYIASERQNPNEETRFDFYDMDFNHLDIVWGHPNSKKSIEKPEKFELMCHLASELSKGIPHVRVDFYEVDRKVYFGEFTFFTYSGMTPFIPDKWDRVFGEWIKLPQVRGK